MQELAERDVYCPYCGEPQTVLVDLQELGDEYIEDCTVCCKPIAFVLREGLTEEFELHVHQENDVF